MSANQLVDDEKRQGSRLRQRATQLFYDNNERYIVETNTRKGKEGGGEDKGG